MGGEISTSDVADVDVVVVGAGLSGLVTATHLTRGGVENIVVLEARDRVGGRLDAHERPNGELLMTGGEYTGSAQAQLHKLAAELGIAFEPFPPFADDQNPGAFVRVFDGQRYVEAFPFEKDPAGGEAFAAATAALDALSTEVPARAPWTAANADMWDHTSVAQWLEANVPSPAARAYLADGLAYLGDLRSASLLHLLWFLSAFGGWEAHETLVGRFVGGTAQLPIRLAAALGDRVATGQPVRRIVHGADGVEVHHEHGVVRAAAVVVAIEPGQAAKLEYVPPLPRLRTYLQTHWTADHGIKYFAVYDRPFWRDEGLAGVAMGPPPFQWALDASETGATEGILSLTQFASSGLTYEQLEQLSDPDASRAMALDALAFYFGEQARTPTEFYAFDWTGDQWSSGCGTRLPLGVLSTAGPALREPVGRIFWAGADAGDMDWMEGAVTAGQRAAVEVAQALTAVTAAVGQ